MFETYSETARKAIFLARYEAGRLNFDSIDVHHLLLGIVLEDQADSELHLHKALGIVEPQPLPLTSMQAKDSFFDSAMARNLLAEFSGLGPRPDSPPLSADMPLTEKASQALSAAFGHANGSQVSPLHLLWGVLADEGAPTTLYLIANGVTRERVESGITGRPGGR